MFRENQTECKKRHYIPGICCNTPKRLIILKQCAAFFPDSSEDFLLGFFRDFLFYGISYKTMNAGNIRLAFQGRKEAVARQFVENFPSVVFIEIKQLWNPPQRNRVGNHHRREIQRFACVWRKSGKRRIQYCVHGFGSVTRQVAGLIRHLLKRFSMICNKAVVLLLIGYMFILVKIRSGKFHSQREPRQQLGDVSSGFRFL